MCIHAFVMLHENRISPVLYYIVICGLSDCTIFFISSHIRHEFLKKKIVCFVLLLFLLQLLPETFLILRRIERDVIINVHRYSCKVPLILVKFE
jgi:hypothetical protein